LLSTAQDDLAQGLEELRELARGLHPVLLTERGLGPALDALLARTPVPVEIAELPDERLDAPVEAAAYYVVAEAITNVAKYAQASHATVSITQSNGSARVTVTDDGVGGADPAAGSGLRGLAARVEALNGRLDVESPPERGTIVKAEMPLG
jgi:signal transduction histidine kinase